MEHLPLIMFILIVGSVSVLIDRRVQQRRAAQQAALAEQAAAQTSPDQAMPSGNWLRKWRRQFTPPKQADPLQPFRAWIVEAFADQPETRYWLAALPDPALKAFFDELTFFCRQLGFELNWVMEKQMAQQPALTQRLQTVVQQYGMACHEAVLAQADIKIFKAWYDFEQNPYGKAEQQLAQKVFEQLVNLGLTTPLAEALQNGPEQDRQIYLVQLLRQEYEKQPLVFQQVLNAVLNTPEAAPTPEVPPAETKRRWFKKEAPAPEVTPA